MRRVLDCSVAIKWFNPEPLSDVAESLLIEQQEGKLSFIAPDILIPEFTGTLASFVTSGDIELGLARYALAEFLSMHIELVPSESLARRAFELSLAHSGTVYDALYVALAERENLQVLTADDKLVRAFAALNRAISLASLA